MSRGTWGGVMILLAVGVALIVSGAWLKADRGLGDGGVITRLERIEAKLDKLTQKGE